MATAPELGLDQKKSGFDKEWMKNEDPENGRVFCVVYLGRGEFFGEISSALLSFSRKTFLAAKAP